MSFDLKPLFDRKEEAIEAFAHGLYHAALHSSAQKFVTSNAQNDDVSKAFAQRELTAMMIDSARETFMQLIAALEDRIETYHEQCNISVTSLHYADERLHSVGVRFTKGSTAAKTSEVPATPQPVQPAEPVSEREGATVVPVEVDLAEAQLELERVTSGIARESAPLLDGQLADFDNKLDTGIM